MGSSGPGPYFLLSTLYLLRATYYYSLLTTYYLLFRIGPDEGDVTLEFWTRELYEPIIIAEPEMIFYAKDDRTRGPAYHLDFTVQQPGAVGGGFCLGGMTASCSGQFLAVEEGPKFPVLTTHY